MHPEGTGNGADEGSEQDTGETTDIDHQLKLIRFMHADAGFVDTGERGQLLSPETGMDFILGFHIAGAHGHDLGTERKHVSRLGKGKNVSANQLRLIFPDFHEVSLDCEAVILTAVFPGQGSAVEIGDAVGFTALVFEISGSDDAHQINLLGYLWGLSDRPHTPSATM